MVHCFCGLFVTDDEEVLFCDSFNNRVRKIDRNGVIITIAGNGKKVYNGHVILATMLAICLQYIFLHNGERCILG